MCTHKDVFYLNLTGKGFWWCDDCNHEIPEYIVKFSEKFKKFMSKNEK